MVASNRVFRALADPTRREILSLLRPGPLTSGEIAEQFRSSWPTISRHLAVLRDAGLVRAEKNGQEVSYELDTSVVEDVAQQILTWAESTRGRRRAARTRAATQEG